MHRSSVRWQLCPSCGSACNLESCMVPCFLSRVVWQRVPSAPPSKRIQKARPWTSPHLLGHPLGLVTNIFCLDHCGHPLSGCPLSLLGLDSPFPTHSQLDSFRTQVRPCPLLLGNFRGSRLPQRKVRVLPMMCKALHGLPPALTAPQLPPAHAVQPSCRPHTCHAQSSLGTLHLPLPLLRLFFLQSPSLLNPSPLSSLSSNICSARPLQPPAFRSVPL